MGDTRQQSMVSRRRLIVGGGAFIAAGIALAVASELRPVAAEPTVSAYVAAAASVPERLPIAAVLYFLAALCLLPGPLALGGWRSVRGAKVIYVGSLMTLVGALWFVVEAVGMVVLGGLVSAPEQAPAILERINQGGGPMILSLLAFLLSPLVLGIGYRRAHLAGGWFVGLWAISFVVGFTAESQVGADIPAIRTLSSVLLGVLVAASGLVLIRAAMPDRANREALSAQAVDA